MTTPDARGTGAGSTAPHETTTARTTGGDPTVGAQRSPVSHGAHEVAEPHDRDFAARRDLVRWGPLWAGLMVTIATFLVMQLAIFAAELFTDGGGGAGSWLSALAALVAFFLGGLTTSATARWHRVGDGAVNGALLWAFATVGLVLLAILGGGTLAGPVSTVAADLGAVQDLNLQNPPTEQVNQALAGARDAAGWSLLGLALSFVSCVAGGAAGAKAWPNRSHADTTARDAELG